MVREQLWGPEISRKRLKGYSGKRLKMRGDCLSWSKSPRRSSREECFGKLARNRLSLVKRHSKQCQVKSLWSWKISQWQLEKPSSKWS